jgi:hypothetical protein
MTNEQMIAAANAYAEAMEKKDARIAELEVALKPFAWHFATEGLFEKLPDDYVIVRCNLKVGDLRAARAAYLGEKE